MLQWSWGALCPPERGRKLRPLSRLLRPALAQKTLEIACNRVCRGQLPLVGRVFGVLLVHRAFEALHEGLYLGVARDGRGDLALVVVGRGLELAAVHGEPGGALEGPHERERHLR